jgi:hypothetical protein
VIIKIVVCALSVFWILGSVLYVDELRNIKMITIASVISLTLISTLVRFI